MERTAYEYYAGGACDEVSLRENRLAFERLALRYRVLVDVTTRDRSTTILGTRVPSPICIAPTAYHRLAHPDGELATARAAAATGTLMTMSTMATSTMEDLAATGATLWFQLYVYKDREVSRDLVQEAEARGFRALALTVDTPTLGRRERDVRNSFALPEGVRVANGPLQARAQMRKAQGHSGLALQFHAMQDASVSWKDVEWLRSITKVPLVLKGVVRGDDAARAASVGVDGVWVSNHGGRQLDSSPATIRVLPEVVSGADGRCEVYLDGGVRRGTDVIKALALGARAVFLGRPVLWGLAANGEAGVAQLLRMLNDELDLAMALCGCPTIADVTPDLVLG
jgi:4-hydroxymandelate oxidase